MATRSKRAVASTGRTEQCKSLKTISSNPKTNDDKDDFGREERALDHLDESAIRISPYLDDDYNVGKLTVCPSPCTECLCTCTFSRFFLSCYQIFGRSRVVRYIYELAVDFKLRDVTMSTAVNYFDRYIASTYKADRDDPSVERVSGNESTQRVASTCVLMAAKFVDVHKITLLELERVHSNRSSAQDFLKTELRVLKALGWKLRATVPADFLCIMMPMVSTGVAAFKMTSVLEMASLFEHDFLSLHPRQLAGVILMSALVYAEVRSDATDKLALMCRLSASELQVWHKKLLDAYLTIFEPSDKFKCDDHV